MDTFTIGDVMDRGGSIYAGNLMLSTWKRAKHVGLHPTMHSWFALALSHKLETPRGDDRRTRETSVVGIHHAPVTCLQYLQLVVAWCKAVAHWKSLRLWASPTGCTIRIPTAQHS